MEPRKFSTKCISGRMCGYCFTYLYDPSRLNWLMSCSILIQRGLELFLEWPCELRLNIECGLCPDVFSKLVYYKLQRTKLNLTGGYESYFKNPSNITVVWTISSVKRSWRFHPKACRVMLCSPCAGGRPHSSLFHMKELAVVKEDKWFCLKFQRT